MQSGHNYYSKALVNTFLRRVIEVRWPDTILNEEASRRTGQLTVNVLIRKRKWQQIGH